MRAAFLVLILLLTFLLAWMNVGVHRTSPVGSSEEAARVSAQLHFLRPRMHAGLGAEMQQMFPEGSAFAHALYGLTWCNVAATATDDAARTNAVREATWAYVRLYDTEVLAPFPSAATPARGVFHAGWSNYVLARIVEVSADRVEPSLIALFDRRSAELAAAFSASGSPFPESYPGHAWPADNTVAMASLALHVRLRSSTHRAVVQRWLDQVKERTDANGLVPHAWDPATDRMAQPGRGCSQALINSFLPTIDSAFATTQFALFRRHFFMERCGLPVVREHPHGVYGGGDVDSGPVIMGVGSSATIVAAGACRANGDLFHAYEFACTADGLGFAKGGDRRHYIFGVLPIVDLFIAWGRSMPGTDPVASAPRFLRFHLWSVVITLLLWSPFLWRWWKRRRA